MTDLNNHDFDPFGDFFNDLNNFKPSSNNVPPTQSGGDMEKRWLWTKPAHFNTPSQKDSLEEYSINITGARREILTLLSVEMRRCHCYQKSSNRRAKNNPVLIGEPGVE